MSSHFGKVSEVLDAQQFWNNTQKISEDLFQDYFNITMQVQQAINSLNELVENQYELKRQGLQKQKGARKGEKGQTQTFEVKNKEISQFMD